MADTNVMEESFFKNILLYWETLYKRLPYICEDNTGHFIMFSVITNIYNKKTKGRTLMELFTATQPQEN
jgi:hypothetical protein